MANIKYPQNLTCRRSKSSEGNFPILNEYNVDEVLRAIDDSYKYPQYSLGERR